MSEPVTLDMQFLSIIVGVAIPLLVGLLTKLDAPSGLKAVANALLSAVAGTVTQLIESGGTFVPREAITAIGVTWVVSVATYYGLWKPTGTSEVVQLKTASFGADRRSASTQDRDVA